MNIYVILHFPRFAFPPQSPSPAAGEGRDGGQKVVKCFLRWLREPQPPVTEALEVPVIAEYSN
jgi:hypothetical protein